MPIALRIVSVISSVVPSIVLDHDVFDDDRRRRTVALDDDLVRGMMINAAANQPGRTDRQGAETKGGNDSPEHRVRSCWSEELDHRAAATFVIANLLMGRRSPQG